MKTLRKIRQLEIKTARKAYRKSSIKPLGDLFNFRPRERGAYRNRHRAGVGGHLFQSICF